MRRVRLVARMIPRCVPFRNCIAAYKVASAWRREKERRGGGSSKTRSLKRDLYVTLNVKNYIFVTLELIDPNLFNKNLSQAVELHPERSSTIAHSFFRDAVVDA